MSKRGHTVRPGDRPGRNCASIRLASSISLRVLFFRLPLGHSQVTFDLRHAYYQRLVPDARLLLESGASSLIADMPSTDSLARVYRNPCLSDPYLCSATYLANRFRTTTPDPLTPTPKTSKLNPLRSTFTLPITRCSPPSSLSKHQSQSVCNVHQIKRTYF
jgi:hypothetical protein